MEARTTDHNNLGEIEDLRVERLPEKLFKTIQSKTLLKIIILGDTGKSPHPILTHFNCPAGYKSASESRLF